MGPYAGQDIVRLAEKGELRPDDFVWRPGFDGWKPVHTIVGLAAPTSDPTPRAIDAAGPSPEVAVQEESAPQAAAGAKPSGAAMPAELEPTWKRAVAVWWLILWRSLLGGMLGGLAIGWVLGFVLGFAGVPQSQITIAAAIVGWIVGLVANVVAVQMALKKQYAEFRLALIPRNAQQ